MDSITIFILFLKNQFFILVRYSNSNDDFGSFNTMATVNSLKNEGVNLFNKFNINL